MKKDRISVLHLRSSTGNGGGPEKTILNSPLYIDQRKFQMEIVYLKKRDDQDFRIAKRAQELGLENFDVVEEGSHFDPQAMSQIRDLINRLGVDILHTHDYKSDWWGWLLRKTRPNIRLITTVHGWGVMNSLRERIYYQVGKLPLYFFDRIIAVNEEIIRSLWRIGVRKKKMVLIRNAIDSNIYCRRAPTGNDGEGLNIGYIGRLSKEKRLEDLILAFSKLSKEKKIGKLLIAGEGPEFGAVRSEVAKRNLSNRVHFLGYSDTKSFFTQVDIFVNPSLKEGLPNTILESMAMGTVVIATSVGGVADLVKHGQTGFIIPTKSPDGIQGMVMRLLENPDQCEEVVKNAREMISTEYDFATRMRKIEGVYEDVLRGRFED